MLREVQNCKYKVNILRVRRISTIHAFSVVVLAPIFVQLIRTLDWDQNLRVRLDLGLSEKAEQKTNPTKSEVTQWLWWWMMNDDGCFVEPAQTQHCTTALLRCHHRTLLQPLSKVQVPLLVALVQVLQSATVCWFSIMYFNVAGVLFLSGNWGTQVIKWANDVIGWGVDRW